MTRKVVRRGETTEVYSFLCSCFPYRDNSDGWNLEHLVLYQSLQCNTVSIGNSLCKLSRSRRNGGLRDCCCNNDRSLRSEEKLSHHSKRRACFETNHVCSSEFLRTDFFYAYLLGIFSDTDLNFLIHICPRIGRTPLVLGLTFICAVGNLLLLLRAFSHFQGLS